MAAAMPFIVMTGMHWAFIPVVFGALATPAGESLMLPAMLISNLGIGGVCFGVVLKSKNQGLKQLGASSGVSALFAGVTEPGLYGVLMPLKKPLFALVVSNAIASGESLSSRPQMLQLLELINTGQYAGVVCIDIKRLSRCSAMETGYIMQILQTKPVSKKLQFIILRTIT